VKIKHVPPIGQLTARLAICGEAPGREEEAQGIPFVPWAPSGAKLMQLAHNAGLVRADMYLTNVIKTRPPNNNISTFFSEGSFTALGERYRRELLDELQAVESPVVLAVGYVAMAALTTERRPIHLMRGSPLINQQLNKIIIPTLHPAGIMRSGQHMQYHLIEWDIRNALALAAEGGISALPSPNYVLDPSFETAMAWLAELPSLPEFAFDIETSSNELTHISFTRALDDVISIPLGKFNPAQRKSILNGIQTALAAPGPRKITQNGNYDTFFLKWHCNIETDLSTLDDAMVANSVLFPQLAPASAPDAATGKSLAMLASLWGREVYYKDDGEITKFDGDSLGYQLYNAKDSAVVHRCWRRLKTFLDADPAFRYTYDFTMARLPAIQAMQTNGFRVDRRGLALARAAILAELTELSAELNALAQPRLRLQLDAELDTLRDLEVKRKAARAEGAETKPLTKRITALRTYLRQWSATGSDGKPELGAWELPVNSSAKLCTYFYDWLGLPEYTAVRKNSAGVSRTRSVNDVALTKFLRPTEDRPAVAEAAPIQKIRERGKLISTYIDIDYMPNTGRYQASFNLRGTWTGRYSSSQLFFRYGSNQQNIPPRIRQYYLPDEATPSRLPFFVEYDGKQAEWVVVAHEANEPRMIEVIQTRRDPHVATAQYMWGVSEAAIVAEAKAVGKSTSPEVIAAARAALSSRFPELAAPDLPRNMTLRQGGKKDNHAGNYREGPETYAQVNGVTLREARLRLSRYSEVVYPGLLTWWENTDFRVRHQGFLINPLGRKLPILGPTHGKGAEHTFKQGYAAIPQSVVHDIAMIGQLRVLAMQPTVLLLSDNHDSILVQHFLDPRVGPEACSEKLLSEVSAVVSALTVPLSSVAGEYVIEIEPKLGLNWADANEENPRGLRELELTPDGASAAVSWLLENTARITCE